MDKKYDKYDPPKEPPKPKNADERPLAEVEDVENFVGGGGDERRGPRDLGGG